MSADSPRDASPQIRPLGFAWSRLCLAATAFLAFAAISGWDLGHYALWDDEANTALIAQGVARTMDTSARIAENIVAFRGGSALEGEKARYVSPLQYYVAAPSISVLGNTSFAARLPFWLFGLAAFALVLRRLLLQRASVPMIAAWSVAFICCISLVLYVRQSRYYSLALFFSVWAADLYLFVTRSRERSFLLGLASSLAFVSNYLNGVALIGALALDAMCFGELKRTSTRVRSRSAQLKELAPLGISHLLISVPVFLIWNPLGKDVVDVSNTLIQKLVLLFRNFRDANSAEFIPISVFVAAAILGWVTRTDDLKRAIVAVVAYFGVVALFSPQPVGKTQLADIRYLVPTLPLFFFIVIRVGETIVPRWPYVVPALVALSYGTSSLNGDVFSSAGVRSTPLLYLAELREGYTDPYRAAVDWLRTNACSGEIVLVFPGHMRYPLMYHIPDLRYSWQLPESKRAAFSDLPDWQFAGQGAPDLIVAFGDEDRSVSPLLRAFSRQAIQYRQAVNLPVFGRDRFRPELPWRVFSEVKSFDRGREGIRIYRRVQVRDTVYRGPVRAGLQRRRCSADVTVGGSGRRRG